MCVYMYMCVYIYIYIHIYVYIHYYDYRGGGGAAIEDGDTGRNPASRTLVRVVRIKCASLMTIQVQVTV